jgi:orotidine-5'-phosphate decarboxylase
MNKEKIIVALDVETANEAREIIGELGDAVGAYKIGLQLFTAEGAKFVREMVEAGNKIFLDVKYHDIPNTVAKASVEAARLGVWMFNLHALGGGEMMRRTINDVREVCEKENVEQPKIIAVTILTSSNQETLSEIGIENEIESQVLKLAKLTGESGLDGVVASPHEAAKIRAEISNKDFLIVTPGIRPAFSVADDQKRITTPYEAVKLGADYLVIGRPITAAKNRLEAVEKIVQELSEGKV